MFTPNQAHLYHILIEFKVHYSFRPIVTELFPRTSYMWLSMKVTRSSSGWLSRIVTINHVAVFMGDDVKIIEVAAFSWCYFLRQHFLITTWKLSYFKIQSENLLDNARDYNGVLVMLTDHYNQRIRIQWEKYSWILWHLILKLLQLL